MNGIFIKDAMLLMPDGRFEPGGLLIAKGKIAAVGKAVCDSAQGDARVIDAAGRYVTPGLIDAHCHVGIMEEGVGEPGDDANETSALCTPQMRGEDGVNPFDRGFDDALAAGVTTVVTGPGSANVVGGTFCALKTLPGAIEQKMLCAPVALKAAFGENPKRLQKDRCASRMGNAAALRALLARAGRYVKGAESYFDGAEVLARVLSGELPLKIHAHRADDILAAIRLCGQYGIRYTIDHCTEGYKIAGILKSNNACCVIGPTLITRMKVELSGLDICNGAVLEQNGIECAIATDHPETPVSLLAASAGLAVRGGMSREAAMRAITTNAARLCGLEKRVGALKAGMDADIAMFDGHPLDICSRTVLTIINGEEYYNKL